MRCAVAVALVLGLSQQTLWAQSCVGDCQHNFQVRSDDVFGMVETALADEPADNCMEGDADGDGSIGVEEIVAAAANANAGCPQPEFAGSWKEDRLHITSSSCPTAVNQSVQAVLDAQDSCVTRFTVVGYGRVQGVDCKEGQEIGSIEGVADLRFQPTPVMQTMSNCTVTLATLLQLSLADSPATGHYQFNISARGNCTLSRCSMQVESRWTKQG